MSRYKAYSEYKDSGINWLNNIPTHWGLVRFKNIFKIQKRIAGVLGHDVLSITQRGVKVKDTESGDGQLSMDYSKYQLVYKNDFAMNHMDLLTGYVDISSFNGVTSPDYRVFTLDDKKQHPKYFLYLLQLCYIAKIFYPLGQGAAQIGRWRLPTEAFNEFVAPTPSYDEQQSIVAFLDHETAKIDALIEKQQRLIELLKEKRQAVISHAVTKGLNPNAPMKDSGVEWLGEVPAHWRVWKIAHAFGSIGSGTTPRSDNLSFYENGNTPWLNTGDLNDGELYKCERSVTKIALAEYSTLKLYRENSLAIAMYGATIGKLAILRFSTTVNQACCVFGESEIVSIKFLFYWLFAFRRQIISLAIGGGQPNISQETLRNLRLACPNMAEQSSIIDYLDLESAKFDELAEKSNRAIEMLQERRTALISAAVAGKIDVRDWQPAA